MTVEQFLNNEFSEIYKTLPQWLRNKVPVETFLKVYVREQNLPEMIIKFAKLHVEAALIAASENLMLNMLI